MKIVDKLLHVILGVIVLIVALILLCATNKDVRNAASMVAQKIGPIYVPKEETEEEAAAAKASTGEGEEEAEEEQKYVVSMDPSKFIFADELEYTVVDLTKDDENTNKYEEATQKRDLSDVVDPSVTNDYNNGDDTYKDLLENGSDSVLYNDDYFRQFEDKNSYDLTDPDIINITDAEEAQKMADESTYGETGEDAQFDALFYPYYHMLGDKEKRLYKQIYANANAMINEFKPVEECTSKEWLGAFENVLYDHPELFWLDGSYYTEYDYSGNIVKVNVHYYSELPDLEKARTRFNSDTATLLAGAQNLESDYEKEKYIHQLLVDKITYMHNSMDQSSYSSIPNDYTVCCGYAKAFQYLMQKLGVPTYFCVGWGGEMHAWNIIKLEDDYYNVDCTWDDQNPMIYDYFNVSDKDNLMHTRMYQSRYLPPCNGSKYSGLENEEIDYKKLKLSSDKIYSSSSEYVNDLVEALNADIDAKKKSSDVKFVISKDFFLEWYTEFFNTTYTPRPSEPELHVENGFIYDISYERLSNGDYLIEHIAQYQE